MKYKVELNKESVNEMCAHISKGNTKIGEIVNFSLLPGTGLIELKSDNSAITNVRGTCGGCGEICEKACYAVNSLRRYYTTCGVAWGENTLLARFNIDKLISDIDEYLIKWEKKNEKRNEPKEMLFRWHVAGEIPTYDYLLRICELMKKHPKIQFYIYTKRWQMLDRFIEEGNEFPKNLGVNLSQWNNSLPNKYNFHEFVYVDKNCELPEDATEADTCPAVIRNKVGQMGRLNKNVHCSQCRKCLLAEKGKKTYVYEH